ncbi:class I SAM-dependent methyltransferase [Micromonospora wenchangensis]|uniref:class I SAM-dependent methyltransferase n=1 Tax=Micromonospora wenchangensis TaxID=1185415 RepID=UPI00381AE262
MDPTSRADRAAWELAHQERVWADDQMTAEAAGVTLLPSERALLRDILATRPLVVHPQSGNGQDDVALVDAGARLVIGVDYSGHAVRGARGLADALGAACHYLLGTVPGVPLRDGCVGLVHTARAR